MIEKRVKCVDTSCPINGKCRWYATSIIDELDIACIPKRNVIRADRDCAEPEPKEKIVPLVYACHAFQHINYRIPFCDELMNEYFLKEFKIKTKSNDTKQF